jgi:2-methylisoborneol synthase
MSPAPPDTDMLAAALLAARESPVAAQGGAISAPLPDVPAGSAGAGLAALIAALLSDPRRPDPTRLPTQRADRAPGLPDRRPAPDGIRAPLVPGPVGLGTSAARLLSSRHAPPDVAPATRPQGPPLVEPPSGFGNAAWWIPGARPAPEERQRDGTDASVPELFCPGAVRDDPALGREVNDRLVAWADEIGIYPGRLEKLRAYDFGRLIMLAHPGSDDPDRLLAATKCVVAEWVADDYYVDEVDLGADPSVVASRLTLLTAVVDPRRLVAQYDVEFADYRAGEPIATAFRSAMEHMSRYASTTQMARFQHQMGILFVAWTQEAEWHRTGRTPAVWEYLVQRHLNSYLPPMLLVDPVAGYELPASEYYDPRVRRAVTTAAAANVLLNDLYSAPFESDTDFNLPRVIALEDGCSQGDAIRRTVEIHNELMHAFVADATALSMTGSPMLHRFFVDTWAWMGGSREWHAGSGRFQSNAVE